MLRIAVFIYVASIFFSGCSMLFPRDEVLKSNEKVFEQEDTLILFALRAESKGSFRVASSLFEKLYNKSRKREYLYRSIQNLLPLKQFDEVIQKIDAITDKEIKDFYLARLKILALVQQNKIQEAKKLSISLVETSKEVKDYILVSEILTELKEFDLAIKYLESAYKDEYDEKVLDKLSIILYVNLQRKKDAIAYLETHTRAHGYTELICRRLISIYSNENNIDGLISTYLKYYEIKPTQEIAKQIVQLYSYKKEYNKIIVFLQDSKSNDEMLLELYVASKNYKKAYPLAKELYDKTGEVKYLGESIVYEYESNIKNLSKRFLSEITKKFETLLGLDASSYLLNYYGYILIDHDINPKKGIKYVKKALEQEPYSAFYLDSLAWGYYKIGKCDESLKLIQDVMKLEGGDDPEVIKHYDLIKQCEGKKQK